MNKFVPDWGMEDSSRSFNDVIATTNQKKPFGQENQLVELLWCNGHVVMQSQTNRKSPASACELKQAPKPETLPKSVITMENTSNVTQEEPAPWFQYSLDDSLEKDLFSDFLCELPTAGTGIADKLQKGVSMEQEKCRKIGATNEESVMHGDLMPPPRSNGESSMQDTISLDHDDDDVDLSSVLRPRKADGGKELVTMVQKEAGESSMMTIESSIWGSNLVHAQTKQSRTMSSEAAGAIAKERKEDVHAGKLPCGNMNHSGNEAACTSSSDKSNCSFGRTAPQSRSNHSNKRKGRDIDDQFESPSEEAEFESGEAKKMTQRPKASRKSRAAEVHNLSERKRRDRINEKMKALQELIPHCNKTDKASMLDEAIEYLKSLQLQVQMMWMGSSMPMIFPGVHPYIPHMGYGMSPLMPPVPSAVQLPRIPFMNQSITSNPLPNQTTPCKTTNVNAASFANPMQSMNLAESHARYFGLNNIQPPSQAMSFYPFATTNAQQIQIPVLPNGLVHPAENMQDNKTS